MKKLTLIIAMALVVMSCKKEKYCNCGEIVSDNVSNYSVTIKNDCTGNYKEFILNESDWMSAYVGKNYCITNSGKW
jgi:hypothetical protein